ncbi:MAG: GNAT family protein [Thermomicrobiales bacterium]
MPNPPCPDEPIVSIHGGLITLGPLIRDLVPTLTRWMNDLDGRRTLAPAAPRPMTVEAETGWFDSITTSDDIVFLIRERTTGVPIGTSSLMDVDFRNRSAMFGIYIGEASARGKGYGSETTRLMLDYAFNLLGLNSVRLGVAAFNPAGVRAYEKAGFREVGRWREHWWHEGALWDEILMDCLAREFTACTGRSGQ